MKPRKLGTQKMDPKAHFKPIRTPNIRIYNYKPQCRSIYYSKPKKHNNTNNNSVPNITKTSVLVFEVLSRFSSSKYNLKKSFQQIALLSSSRVHLFASFLNTTHSWYILTCTICNSLYIWNNGPLIMPSFLCTIRLFSTKEKPLACFETTFFSFPFVRLTLIIRLSSLLSLCVSTIYMRWSTIYYLPSLYCSFNGPLQL